MARKVDTRISELVAHLERVGAPVQEAMSEAVLRSMGGSPFAAALTSVAEDFAQGIWPHDNNSTSDGPWEDATWD